MQEPVDLEQDVVIFATGDRRGCFVASVRNFQLATTVMARYLYGHLGPDPTLFALTVVHAKGEPKFRHHDWPNPQFTPEVTADLLKKKQAVCKQVRKRLDSSPSPFELPFSSMWGNPPCRETAAMSIEGEEEIPQTPGNPMSIQNQGPTVGARPVVAALRHLVIPDHIWDLLLLRRARDEVVHFWVDQLDGFLVCLWRFVSMMDMLQWRMPDNAYRNDKTFPALIARPLSAASAREANPLWNELDHLLCVDPAGPFSEGVHWDRAFRNVVSQTPFGLFRGDIMASVSAEGMPALRPSELIDQSSFADQIRP